MDSGHNPHPHLGDTPYSDSMVPRPRSIREPSKAFKIVALVIGLSLVALFGYTIVWRSTPSLPEEYCSVLALLNETLQQAADGTITPAELASNLILVESQLDEASSMVDPSSAAHESIVALGDSVEGAMSAANNHLDMAPSLSAVRLEIGRTPHCS